MYWPAYLGLYVFTVFIYLYTLFTCTRVYPNIVIALYSKMLEQLKCMI
jgi:hypothetical protein